MITADTALIILNDLIEVNLDHCFVWEKAAKALAEDNTELHAFFHRQADASRHNANELAAFFLRANGTAQQESTLAFMPDSGFDIKSTFSSMDMNGLLDMCERCGDAVSKVYRAALVPGNGLSGDVLALIRRQQTDIEAGQQRLKELRPRC